VTSQGLLFHRSMERINIIEVTLRDIDQLQKIGRDTFSETFSAANTEENMRKYLEEEFAVEKLAAEVQNANSAFYFATIENEVIGYLKLNFGQSQTELKDEHAVEIERIYVMKKFHGRKAGQMLYEKAMQVARQKNANYLWLGVWEQNIRAMNFYKKNSFKEFDKHIFRLGADEQTDIMMKYELNDRNK
jgi:diamine N-acetyltransferase